MVLERWLGRKTPLARLELDKGFSEGIASIRDGINDFIQLSQERPDLSFRLNTEPTQGSPYLRPGPTIHDFFERIGWSRENERKSLAFSEEPDRLTFTVSHDLDQREEELLILISKNSNLIELQFRIRTNGDGEELSNPDKRIEKAKQKMLAEMLEKDCTFSGNQAVFVYNLKAVIEDARQLALVA